MEKNMRMEKNMVSWKERIGYGLGDTASNLTFMVVTLYLMYFYTDVVGLNPAAVAVLLLITKIWDAVNDPLMGLIVDRTHTKWGQCRPYFLWGALPYAIFAVLMFTTAGSNMGAKLAFAYVGYIGFDLAYTIVNIPYSAILPSLTSNYAERTVVNSVRMIFSRIGAIIVSLATLPLVARIGQGNEAKGFQGTVIIFSIIAVFLFLITFFSTKERIPQSSGEHMKLKESFRALKGNSPWWVLLFLNIAMWTGFTMMQQTIIYFCKYNLGNAELSGPYMPIMMIGMFAALALMPKMSKRAIKRTLLIIGEFISILGMVISLIFAHISIPAFFAGVVISGFGFGMVSPLIFSMLADVVDYGEWKNGVRASGFLYSASSLGIKFGMSIGGAIGAWILASAGYVGNAVQTQASLNAIQFIFILAPIIANVLCIIICLFYKIDKKYPEIKADLEKKRGQVVEEPQLADTSMSL
mgnify:CR=1 FL=1